jgi:hypothetical protein
MDEWLKKKEVRASKKEKAYIYILFSFGILSNERETPTGISIVNMTLLHLLYFILKHSEYC